MMAIFHDMIEKTMEVFMDDFLVFGSSFSTCPNTFEKRYAYKLVVDDTNLALNWEKSHFMVKEGIVLGHKISKSGIEDCMSWVGNGHEKHFRPIHYASKTMNEAESRYTPRQKQEMLAWCMQFAKIPISSLVMNKCTVNTDHSPSSISFAKNDSKARLLRWVLLLHENPHKKSFNSTKEINEKFPHENLSFELLGFVIASTPCLLIIAKLPLRGISVDQRDVNLAGKENSSRTKPRHPHGLAHDGPNFILSLADVDSHFMMEDESLLWTSNDVVILLQHGSEKIPLNYVSETEITCFSIPSAAIYSGYLAG
ncbi:DNA-directed DNA polymerase [Tanacetum coccineum]